MRSEEESLLVSSFFATKKANSSELAFFSLTRNRKLAEILLSGEEGI
jgi:hypothetical protein